MVLWWRESNHAEALFIDLLPSKRDADQYVFLSLKLLSQKNDRKSIRLRESGNEKFKSKNWLEAMELYNQSLRYATEGSNNISLGYANRSVCFFHIEEYDKSMVDIELAKKANYPERLMPKLVEREVNCINWMKKSTQTKTVTKPTLSFEADEKFPCMANVLQIRSNDEFGKHIVAKADIEVGKFILVEDAFIVDTSLCDVTICKTCAHFTMNFFPCPGCNVVSFCSAQCMQSNEVHKISCGASYNRVPGVTAVVESVLRAIIAFSNVDELMTFVEKSLVSRDFDSYGTSNAQTNYDLFLKLLGRPKPIDPSVVSKALDFLFDIPRIKARFDTIKKQRFLMHLILQHFLIIHSNTIAFGSNEDMVPVLGNIASLFNHSCYRNTTMGVCGNQLVAYAVRPIKKDEQLFIRYTSEFMLPEFTKVERQATLRQNFQFECKCSMCFPHYQEMDCLRMQIDPNYLALMFSTQTLQDSVQSKKTSNMKAGLCEFLNKFGRLPWCDEIQAACTAYDYIVMTELAHAYNFYERR